MKWNIPTRWGGNFNPFVASDISQTLQPSAVPLKRGAQG